MPSELSTLLVRLLAYVGGTLFTVMCEVIAYFVLL